MTDSVIERAQGCVDKPAATVLVTAGPAHRRKFIGEVLLAGAILYVVNCYCAGFLEGVGLKDLAKGHGEKVAGVVKSAAKEHSERAAALFEKAAGWLKKLRADEVTDDEIILANREADALGRDVRAMPVTDEARAEAISRLAGMLEKEGILPVVARDVADGVAAAVHD